MRFWRVGYWGIQVLAVAAIFLGIALIARTMPGLTWMKAEAVSAVLVIGSLTAFLAYRYADEVVLQTHKTAWFWGGLIGMIIATAPSLIFVQWHLVTVPLLIPHFGDVRSAYFAEGALMVVLVQSAGFFVALAYLRLRRPKQ